jgi:SRSO17 transposase
VTEKQMAKRRQRLEAFTKEILAPLGRSERRHWGSVYVRGLLLDGERKSVGAMAERLPDGNEQNLQQFVSQSPWPWEPVWERLAQRAAKVFTTTAWIVDDTGFPKKGEHSVGVARQYSGTLGKTAHCQVAVSLHAASATGSSPLGFRLYLPKEWAEDPERLCRAGVPDGVSLQEKWRLGLALIDQALGWGLAPPPVVLADAGYGENGAFRQGLEERHLPYAVGISSQVSVWTTPPECGVPDWGGQGRPTKCVRYGEQRPMMVKEVACANRKRFRSVRWREGSQGQRHSRFWASRVQSAHRWSTGAAPGKAVWLLIEWPPEEAVSTKYYLCDLPASLSLRRMVAITRGRWRVEQDYQQLKEELGLDHFEGRSWTGWHHHVTLVMIAHAFLRREQKRRASKSSRNAARNAP